MIKIKSDKIVLEDRLFCGNIYIENGKIIELSEREISANEVYDFTGYYVSAGFIDIHTHGGGGYAFMNSSVGEVVRGCNYHLLHGTTSIMPTVSAAPMKIMKQAVINIGEAKKDSNLLGNIIGAHLEGPYLSKEQSGAQYSGFLAIPNEKEYKSVIDCCGENIARWTYAPENDSSGIFCKYLTKFGIVPSAGHTNATGKEMAVAVENGCRLITHLYSCTSTVTRDRGFRKTGVVESAFLYDDLFVEIIADGKHLPEDLIRMIVKIKGQEKVALVTDSLSIAGTDIREGVMSGTEFIVEDGVCKLKDRSAFAGSIATANRLIKTLTTDCGYNIIDAVKMMTKVPAEICNISKGKLERGKDADIVVFDDEIKIKTIFVNNKKIDP